MYIICIQNFKIYYDISKLEDMTKFFALLYSCTLFFFETLISVSVYTRYTKKLYIFLARYAHKEYTSMSNIEIDKFTF